MFGQSLNIDTISFVLTNFESFLGTFTDWDEQVLHSFIVDFEHRDVHLVFLIFFLVISDPIEDFLATDWHNALVGSVADHGVRFTCSRLPIGEQATVISLPSIVQDFQTDSLEHCLLISILLRVGSTLTHRFTRSIPFRLE